MKEISFSIIMLILIVTIESYGQRRSKKIKEPVTVDTTYILQRFNNSTFKERNVFWTEKKEVGVILRQSYYTTSLHGSYAIELTIIFPDWHSLLLNTNYDVGNFSSQCQRKGGDQAPRDYTQPKGFIRIVSKGSAELILYFDVYALSPSGKNC